MLALGLVAALLAARSAGAGAVPGELIVGWRDAVADIAANTSASPPAAALDAIGAALAALPVERRQLRPGRWLDQRTQLWRVDPAATAEVLLALQRRPDVAFVEPNHRRRGFAVAPAAGRTAAGQTAMPGVVPDDPLLPLQWYLETIRAQQAWSITTGDPAVVVAVVDTGVVDHPALAGRLVQGLDLVSDPVNAGDGDGRDFDPTDESGAPLPHGTHVAGIIAAAADDGTGIAGLDWRARILPVRVLGRDGTGSDADISDGIRWAAGLEVPGLPLNPYPARVINLSFGAAGYGLALHDAIADAMQAGVVVVAAAGNDGVSASDIYPAAVSGVITVAAADRQGRLARYSNYGAVVDLLAPGGDLSQTFRHQGSDWPAGIMSLGHPGEGVAEDHVMAEGTSQAAPIVSAVVALLAAVEPDLDQLRAAQLLTGTADATLACAPGCGAGMVDAGAALAAAAGIRRSASSIAPAAGSIEAVVGCSLAAAPDPPSVEWLAIWSLLGVVWLLRPRRARNTQRQQRLKEQVQMVCHSRGVPQATRAAGGLAVLGVVLLGGCQGLVDGDLVAERSSNSSGQVLFTQPWIDGIGSRFLEHPASVTPDWTHIIAWNIQPGAYAGVTQDYGAYTGFSPSGGAADQRGVSNTWPGSSAVQARGDTIGLNVHSSSLASARMTTILPQVVHHDLSAQPRPWAEGEATVVVSFDLRVPRLQSAGSSAAYADTYLFFVDQTSGRGFWFGASVADSRGVQPEWIGFDGYDLGTQTPFVKAVIGQTGRYSGAAQSDGFVSAPTSSWRHLEWRLGRAEFQHALDDLVAAHPGSISSTSPADFKLVHVNFIGEIYVDPDDSFAHIGLSLKKLQLAVVGPASSPPTDPPPQGPPPNGSSCVGHCGGKAQSCYCDAACVGFGDCCADHAAVCTGAPADPPPPDPPADPPPQGPPAAGSGPIIGYVDKVITAGGSSSLQGWACFVGHAAPIAVHVYAGAPAGAPGGTFIGAVSPTAQPSEPAIHDLCQTPATVTHRFLFPLEAHRAAHAGKPLYVHGIVPAGGAGNNDLISNSGTVSVPSAAPAGNPGSTASCAGACGGQAPAGCWCDQSCQAYGDCCTDHAAVCSQ